MSEHTKHETSRGATESDSVDQLGYAQAIAELDTILNELERSDVDVDRLAEQVSRAARLIELCRSKIDGARLTIDQVVADLDGAAGDSTERPE